MPLVVSSGREFSHSPAASARGRADAQKSPKTKTPPELNRGGVFATAWLPVAMQAQYFTTLQPVLHVERARLLPLPVSANLTFPQGPSAQSGDFATPLTVSGTNLPR
jgi:hypothetical protein